MENQIQKDELIALESIYTKDEFSYHNDGNHFEYTLKIFLSLPEDYYFEYKDTRQAEEELTKVLISHLPPLTVQVTLPSDYPSESPPVFIMISSWLSHPLLSKLCRKLDELWQENKGEVVLFTWFTFLQNETLEFLNIGESLDISYIYTRYRIALDNIQNQKTLIEPDNDVSGINEKELEKSFDQRAVFDQPVSKNPVQNLIDYNYVRSQIEFKRNIYMCNICFSDKLGKDCTQFVPCYHIFCKECIVGFFEVRINDGAVRNILCPENKCSSEATPGQIKDLVSAELFSKYDHLLLSSTLNTMKDIVYCPRRHCQYPVSVEANETLATCPVCQYAFCLDCTMPYHGVERCKFKGDNKRFVTEYRNASPAEREQFEKRYGKKQLLCLLENGMSEKWISKYSRNCPSCKTAIEDNKSNNIYESTARETETPSSTKNESSAESEIKITVSSIENIERKDSFHLSFVIEHNNVILGTPSTIRVDPDLKHNLNEINYNVSLPVNIDNIDAIVSIPVLIKVFESSFEDKDSSQDTSVVTENEKVKDARKPKLKSITSGIKKLLGMCSLDLYPLLLGENSIKEKLIIEAPIFSWNSTGVSWLNLPLLSVNFIQEGLDFFTQYQQANYLNITIESIHNPLTSFTDSLEYKCGTIIYTDSESSQKVIFEGGKFTNFHEVDGRKSWNTLSQLENRAKCSKYKINCDYENLHNEFKGRINLQKLDNSDIPRIKWNYISRTLLLRSGVHVMQAHIEKYKYWPFQILIRDKRAGTTKAKSKETSEAQIFQCYVDVSALLFPGKTRIRTVAQLYTYNASDMKQKTGLDKDIFEMELLKDPKEKEKKNKNSAKLTSNTTQYLDSPEQEISSSSHPVINEKSEPVIISIEFELYRPIKKSRSMSDWSDELEKLVQKPQSLPPYIFTGDLAEEQFYCCVKKLIYTISDRYQDFVESNKKEHNKDHKANTDDLTKNCNGINEENNGNRNDDFECQEQYIPDELQCFIQYLHNAGEYIDIRNTLKNKIITLLDQKFKTEMYCWDTKESQNYVATAYIYLIEHLHIVLNKTVEDQCSNDESEPEDLENLFLYAEEANNLGDLEDAKHYYTTIISNDLKNPDTWIIYAIFLMKMSDIERAIECCREALVLENRNKKALLHYGVILSVMHQYKEARVFLEALTVFYPRFAEGWVILHLFYHRIEYYPGLDITILNAEKCFKDKIRETVSLPSAINEPLAWSMSLCDKHNIYIVTATLLMKFNLYEFAGLALAKELSVKGRSIPFLYYLSVHHYLRGQYESAITHLKEAKDSYGLDYTISALMGHCYYEFGNFEDALYYYEYANATFNRPNDIHLVHLRLGTCYINMQKYDAAKKIFLTVCRISPTCKTWLGLGIAFYHMNQLREAEMAFTEANRINSDDAVVWGYLTLLNISLEKYNEFSQCYRQAVKKNLKDSKLWLNITKAMEIVGFLTPEIITATDTEKIT